MELHGVVNPTLTRYAPGLSSIAYAAAGRVLIARCAELANPESANTESYLLILVT